MLRQPPQRVSGDDVVDTVGELTNVVAGNLKSLLAPPTTLGLPTVHVGTDCQIRFPGTRRTHHTPLRWRGEPIVASVWALQSPYCRSTT
jgi:chemotaxis protein CheX